MGKVTVVGTGAFLPGAPISNATIESLVGPLPAELMAGISIQKRYWITDPKTGEHTTTNSEMATKAAQQALARAGVEANDVDLLVLATGTPDYPLPPTVNFVQDRLGLKRCATVEIRSGGAGCVQGMDLARMYLERGTYRTAVVIGSEVISPALSPMFFGRNPDDIRMRDRLPLYMFGDGAGAVVLQPTEKDGIVGAAMACIGGGRKPGIQSMGGSATPLRQQLRSKTFPDLRVDVVGSGDFTPYLVTEAISETLRRSEASVESIDLCLIPEGNVGWMLDALRAAGLETAEWVALDGKVFDNLAQTGAVGCAAVPLFLDEAWATGKIRPGSRIMVIGVESTKWIYAGMIVDWTAALPPSRGATGSAA